MADDLRPDIAAAKAAMRMKLGSGREIKKLENHLHQGETVQRMTAGRYGGKNGLVVLTSQRALFIAEGITGKQTEDVPLGHITSVSWKSGMITGTIQVHTAGARLEIDNVNKDDGKAIVEDLRAATAQPVDVAPTAPAAPPQPAGDDPVEMLAKLGQLRDAGVLTQEEFDAKKADILGRI